MGLGLDAAEFFTLTPRMLSEMVLQWQAERRREMTMLALLRHDVINFSFCRPEDPVKLEDLLPEEGGSEIIKPARGGRMDAKRREEVAAAWRRAFEGGEFGTVR